MTTLADLRRLFEARRDAGQARIAQFEARDAELRQSRDDLSRPQDMPVEMRRIRGDAAWQVWAEARRQMIDMERARLGHRRADMQAQLAQAAKRAEALATLDRMDRAARRKDRARAEARTAEALAILARAWGRGGP